MKRVRALFIILVLVCGAQAGAYSSESVLPELVRNSDGTLAMMTQREAFHYCRSIGRRLPTIKQMGKWARRFGARGVQVPGNEVSGFTAWNLDGSSDVMAYDRSGYIRRTVGDDNLAALPENGGLIMTSSLKSKHMAFFFDFYNGSVVVWSTFIEAPEGTERLPKRLPVRCF